jgi:uncharacterized surface protein with fasciclin (FAS1) repeats
MRRLAATAASALLLAAPAGAQNLLEQLAETGRVDRFLSGIEAAGLEGILSRSGPITLFVPTDDAYDRTVPPRLPAAFGEEPRTSSAPVR